jgi:hypothetical protein
MNNTQIYSCDATYKNIFYKLLATNLIILLLLFLFGAGIYMNTDNQFTKSYIQGFVIISISVIMGMYVFDKN